MATTGYTQPLSTPHTPHKRLQSFSTHSPYTCHDNPCLHSLIALLPTVSVLYPACYLYMCPAYTCPPLLQEHLAIAYKTNSPRLFINQATAYLCLQTLYNYTKKSIRKGCTLMYSPYIYSSLVVLDASSNLRCISLSGNSLALRYSS